MENIKTSNWQWQQSTAIDRIKYENNEISDEQQISDICNYHFASIGDKLSRNIAQTQLSAKETLRSFNILPCKPKFTFKMVTSIEVYDIFNPIHTGLFWPVQYWGKGEGVFHLHTLTPLSFKLDDSNVVQNYFGVGSIFWSKKNRDQNNNDVTMTSSLL